MAKFYKLSSTGSIQEWSIVGNLSDATIRIRYGQHHGAMQLQEDKVELNNSGRGLQEQMLLEIRSRITRQKAKGYRKSIAEATKHRNENALNLAKPMLAQRYDKIPHLDVATCLRQFKYDGHRMLVHNNGDEVIAYSRNGKIIDTMDHVLRLLNIPEGVTLDGEVYCHGYPLQTIASWVKRKQHQTLDLKYMVYDLISSEPFHLRYEKICQMDIRSNVTMVVPTWEPSYTVQQDLSMAIQKGYEGIMLRTTDCGYEAGKRSRSLIKVKQVLDDEFLVVDVEKSRDDWGVLVCRTKEKKEFRVSAPGTMEEKAKILTHKLDYIGLMARVEYFSLTNERIPFHPVATHFREKELE